jgi:tetratricopeptide (TPR) repeat protein
MVDLCMIVKADDSEAQVLDRCLNSIGNGVDDKYITITGAKGQCPELEKVCQKHKATISYFNWVKDFALARNFNFSQSKGDYIFWCDSDDVVELADQIKPSIDKMKSEGVDIGIMDYLYDFDEFGNCVVKHRKGRIIKNDGCVKWVGQLHEDLIEQRQIIAYFIPDIKIVHKSTNERYDEAKQRNLEIATNALEKDKDPRNYWNVANSYLAMSKHREAIDYFLRFIEKSGSEIEIFTAYHRMAACYGTLGEYEKAKEMAFKCIDIRPHFPDGYFVLAEIYNKTRLYKKAKEMMVTGLSKEVPEDEYIVWNPRDYDFNPLRILADIYFYLNQPVEAKLCLENCLKIHPKNEDIKSRIKILETEITKLGEVDKIISKLKGKNEKEIKEIFSKIPEEIKSHPKLVSVKNQHFVKTKSSGKDLCIFCYYTEEEFNPDLIMKTGRGGSEEAVMHMSNRLADLGWNVEVFANCGHKEKKYGKVLWKPFWSYNYRDKYDVFIAWRHPTAFNLEINADKKYIWLHDVLSEAEFTPERLAKIDKIFALSEFQRNLFPNIPDNKFFITSNGIGDKFPKVERDPKRIIYSSSYDRGLKCLLELFPLIKKECPETELHVFYGWSVWDAVHKGDPEKAREKQHIMKLMEQDGVYEHGRISQEEIIKEYGKASIWVYPTEFPEISCCTGDTLIDMPRDRQKYVKGIPIKELVGKSNFPVYSYDEGTDSITLGTVNWVKKTRKNAEIWELKLDDGSVLRATGDHRIMKRDGSYCELQNLKPNDSLMPVYERANFMIKQNNGKWINEHRMVGEWKMGRKLGRNEHVNHKDNTRYNNEPDMLEVMSASEHHSKTHTGRVTSPQSLEKQVNSFKKWCKTPEGKIKLSKNGTNRANKFWKEIFPLWSEDKQKEWIQNRTDVRKQTMYNHKVVSVKKTKDIEDVYDMEVEKYNNFGANGIIIHNCITAMKAQAMGCIPVTTTTAALNETVQFGLKVDSDKIYTDRDAQIEFVNGVVNLLQKPPSEDKRKPMVDWAKSKYNWDNVANNWDKIL